jgi:hypothetical protein
MEIVINRSYGGFSLSREAISMYKKLKQIKTHSKIYFNDRTDPILIQVIKELKEKANGKCAELKIVDIPDDVEWVIESDDEFETVEEKHRSWS